jgi:hypothetical protein
MVGLKSAAFLPHITQFKLQALVSSKTNRLGYDCNIVSPESISFKFKSVLRCCSSVNGFPEKSPLRFALIIIFLYSPFYLQR